MFLKKINWRLSVPALILLGILVALSVTSALAVHDLDLFELDRNAYDDPGVPGDDWSTLSTGGGSAYEFSGILPDIGADGGTQFQAGGSKDDLDLSPAGVTGQYWKWEPGEPLDKDDITNAYAAAYIYEGTEVCPDGVPSGDPTCTQPGDLIIYFGLDRYANNGSAQVGFWFFQNPVGLTDIKDGGGFQFSGVHAMGDVLVQSNFTQGGTIEKISVYEWVGSGGSEGTLNLVYEAADCVPGIPGDLACATVNRDDTPSPWPFTPKFGDPDIFPQGSFFEGGINITRLAPEAGCISTFLAETRSSTPFDSRLKDFVLGSFSLCSLEGNKYLDVNGNGVWDTGEPGLENWPINLTGGSIPLTTYTDENGHYIFDGLASGTYGVDEDCPDGTWVQTDPGFTDFAGCGSETYSGIDVNLTTPQITDIDFGNGQPDVAISKSCTENVFVGDTIGYEITVSNPGNVDLYDVSVLDSIFGELGPVDLAANGGFATFNPIQVATAAGTVYNEVTAEGDYALATVSATDDCTTNVYELAMSKTAVPKWVQTFNWTIEKSATPDAEIFENDLQDIGFEINVYKTVFSNDYSVKGTITIDNPATIEAVINSVTDVSDGVSATTLSCPDGGTIAGGGSLVCDYETTGLPDADGNNHAEAVQQNHAYAADGTRGAATGTTTYDADQSYYLAEPTDLVNDSANVSDVLTIDAGLDLGGAGTCTGDCSWPQTVSADASFSYQIYVGSSNAGSYSVGNEATVTFGSDSDSNSDSVTIDVADLTVTKDATLTWVRTFNWSITKSANPDAEIFENDLQDIEFDINVYKTVFSNDYSVAGDIYVTNNASSTAAKIASVSDLLDDGITPQDVVPDCGVSFPYMLAAGDTLTCSYSATVGDADGSNQATAENQNRHFDVYGVGTDLAGTTGYSGSFDYALDAPTDLVNDTAEVSDVLTIDAGLNLGGAGTCTGDCSWPQTVSANASFSYQINVGSSNAGSYGVGNEATVTFTTGSDSDSASVTIAVAKLTVTKTAVPAWERVFDWTVVKGVNPTSVSMLPGGSALLHYDITANRYLYSDTYSVAGDIYVTNNASSTAAKIASVSDLLDDGITPQDVVPDCGVSFPYMLAADDTLTCSYSAPVGDADGSNQATAENQNRHFDVYGVGTDLAGTTGYSGSFDYALAAPTSIIDESATIIDPGLVCPSGFTCTLVDTGDGIGPWYFSASWDVDPFSETVYFDVLVEADPDAPCGADHQLPNVVYLTEDDSGQERQDDALVVISIICEGCTPGFWQGGAGLQLWDDPPTDPQWTYEGAQPFYTQDIFNAYFNVLTDPRLDGLTMIDLVGSGGTNDSARRAARDMVAAYLNESAFPNTYPADSLEALRTMWYDAVAGGDEALDDFHVLVAGWNSPTGGYCPLP